MERGGTVGDECDPLVVEFGDVAQVLTNEDGEGRKRALELGITDGMNTLDGDGKWKGTRVINGES